MPFYAQIIFSPLVNFVDADEPMRYMDVPHGGIMFLHIMFYF
jgi:hypothetical protein